MLSELCERCRESETFHNENLYRSRELRRRICGYVAKNVHVDSVTYEHVRKVHAIGYVAYLSTLPLMQETVQHILLAYFRTRNNGEYDPLVLSACVYARLCAKQHRACRCDGDVCDIMA